MKKASIFRGTVLGFVGIFSLAFILYSVNLELWLNDKSVAVLTSIESYLVTILYFVIPAAIGGAMISSVGALGLKGGLIRCLPLPLPLLIYAVPYYYIYSLLYLTQDSGRALLYACLIGLLECLVFYLEGVVFFLISGSVSGAIARRRAPKEDIKLSASDFSDPFTVGVFIAISIKAVVMATLTIVDTVSYLIEYRGTYLVGEIVAIILDFALIIAELMISHYLLFFVAKRVARNFDKAKKSENTI